MLHKTRGIVFRMTRYGETSVIVNVFTEMFGLQSYIVNGVRTRSAKSNKIALYQPLTLLDMVVYHKENAGILRIKEASCLHAYQTLTSDHRKSAQALFLNEVMNRVIKEQSHAHEICDFLFDALLVLDQWEGRTENFHLLFLLKLSVHLGFGPHNVIEIVGGRVIEPELEEILNKMLQADFTTVIHMTNQQRRELLDVLLQFYAHHVDAMGEIKSIQILREVLA